MVTRILELLISCDIPQREASIRHTLNGCIRYAAVNQHLLGEIIADAQIVYITKQIVGEGLVRFEVKRNAGSNSTSYRCQCSGSSLYGNLQ